MMMKHIIAYLAILVLSMCPVQGSTLMVEEDDGLGAIQGAIDASSAGDLILVRGGIYRERIDVNKAVTLQGIDMPVLDGGGSEGNESIITLSADGVVLDGFEIKNTSRMSEDGGVGLKVASCHNLIKNITR